MLDCFSVWLPGHAVKSAPAGLAPDGGREMTMRKNLQQARKAAGLTQQAMADKLHIGLRHYKKIESAETLGSIDLWDKLEDFLKVNQRVLREIHPDKEDNQ